MYFLFRHDNCVPHGLHMGKTQHVHCMGSWQDCSYTFVVLRHPNAEHAWCLRYSTLGGHEFVGQLFRDVHCDRRAELDGDYLSLSIRRDKSPSMTSLCMDDYEACSYWGNPCSHTVMQVRRGQSVRLDSQFRESEKVVFVSG